jgi:hypothetical protein
MKIRSRQGLLAAAGALMVAALFVTLAQPTAAQTPPGPAAMYAYVGSFTTAQRKARGDGIHVYRADPVTGAWTHIQHIGDLVNPSYLALSHDQRFRARSRNRPGQAPQSRGDRRQERRS